MVNLTIRGAISAKPIYQAAAATVVSYFAVTCAVWLSSLGLQARPEPGDVNNSHWHPDSDLSQDVQYCRAFCPFEPQWHGPAAEGRAGGSDSDFSVTVTVTVTEIVAVSHTTVVKTSANR
jgi:hypothetical protein